jgi:hypothetical protein
VATDTVTTIFGGDDSPFQAVARKVMGTMRSITGFKPPADAFAGIHAGFKGVDATAKGAVASVTALKGAFMELMPIVAGIAGVTSVVAAFGKAIQQAGERETAAQRLGAVADEGENLAGVMGRLEAASAKTGRDFPELAKSVQSFKEAGTPIEAAAGYTEKLNEISLVTGKSLEDLTDVFTRMSVKGEASFKDLAKFIAVPGVSQLAKEFKNLEVETGNLDRATAKQIELWKRQDEQAQLSTAAINNFAKETGIASETFKAWKDAGLGGGRKITSLGGITGLGDVSQKVMNQFAEGMKQIEKETGLSERQIKEFIGTGKLGFESLLSASQRYHEEQQKAREQGAQDRLRAQQEAVVTKQQGLVAQVSALVEQGIDPKKLDAWFETFAGKWYNFAHQISETFEAFGTPLINALKPLMDHLNSDLMPAMQRVAGQLGEWLASDVTDLINAFDTADWSKVEKDIAQVINSLAEMLGTAIEKAVELGFSQGAENLKKQVGGAINPFSKEFWFGGLNIPGLGKTPVNPNEAPVPDNKGPQTAPTDQMSWLDKFMNAVFPQSVTDDTKRTANATETIANMLTGKGTP